MEFLLYVDGIAWGCAGAAWALAGLVWVYVGCERIGGMLADRWLGRDSRGS